MTFTTQQPTLTPNVTRADQHVVVHLTQESPQSMDEEDEFRTYSYTWHSRSSCSLLKLRLQNIVYLSNLTKLKSSPNPGSSNLEISAMATLTYDLQRHQPAFSVAIVDQVLEDVRRGLEQNVYRTNQRRLATIKYLGELYIYHLLNSGIIFDTLHFVDEWLAAAFHDVDLIDGDESGEDSGEEEEEEGDEGRQTEGGGGGGIRETR
ncbi:armadillo-type protein [Lentinula raphanica]|uniref:Armadillo-type protein n=1 Tax=Lentinula raphanica TaxID=153919 RepID=A0AA38U9Y1_9AGAR|nr:armadillo-type protein [Lentinula raphanica]